MNSNTAIEPELLELLRCPRTRLPLRAANGDVLAQLEALRVAGELRDCGGRAVGEASLRAGLISEDGRIYYPVRDGFPVMTVDDSIAVP